jgi:hypothetical protein
VRKTIVEVPGYEEPFSIWVLVGKATLEVLHIW